MNYGRHARGDQGRHIRGAYYAKLVEELRRGVRRLEAQATARAFAIESMDDEMSAGHAAALDDFGKGAPGWMIRRLDDIEGPMSNRPDRRFLDNPDKHWRANRERAGGVDTFRPRMVQHLSVVEPRGRWEKLLLTVVNYAPVYHAFDEVRRKVLDRLLDEAGEWLAPEWRDPGRIIQECPRLAVRPVREQAVHDLLRRGTTDIGFDLARWDDRRQQAEWVAAAFQRVRGAEPTRREGIIERVISTARRRYGVVDARRLADSLRGFATR